MASKQPNFLLISTDQQRADYLGCYGAKVLQTPFIDGLAAQGVRFENAFVASPVCMPNRASLMTGRMPSLHGLRHNGLNLRLNTVTIADVLARAGWQTSLVGKAHFQCVTNNPPLHERPATDRMKPVIPEALHADAGRYDQELVDNWQRDRDHDLSYPYYGFDKVDLAVGHGDLVEGHYGCWLAERCSDPHSLRGRTNALAGDGRPAPQSWRTAVPEELYSTRYIEEKTNQRLADYAHRSEQPFFLWASFCDPHHPFTPPGRYWDMYDPREVHLPETFYNQDRSGFPAVLQQLRASGLANLAGTSAIAVSEAELRSAIALTFGMITMIDDAVGSILARLRHLGLAENTIVVFFSDHGDLMGEHGLLFKGPLHYRALVRTPLIWADGRLPQGRVHEPYVSAIDLPASLLKAAGVAPFNGLQGIPFIDQHGQLQSVRTRVMIEDEIQASVPGHEVRGRVRTLLADQWRLTLYDGIEQGVLHDLSRDPMEIHNLWDDNGSAAVRATLTETLLRQMILHSETSPFPNYAA